MKKQSLIILALLKSFGIGYSSNFIFSKENTNKESILKAEKEKMEPLKLGTFSISLSVKDLSVSKVFYESLGFTSFGGDMSQNYLIMKNESTLIGLFQGMFEGNMLTFNPGWDQNAKNTKEFDDVREIQRHLKTKEIKLSSEADENTTGPASITLTDPDGNVILIDQHR